MLKDKLKLVLASASPRRKELLGHLKVPFDILALNVPEESEKTDPVHFSQEIASIKGEAVFRKLLLQDPKSSYFVVSADTIVCLNGKIYGKPSHRDEAREFLKELSGKTHSVFTAVCVRFSSEGQEDSFHFVEESKVTFNPISKDLLERYLDTGDSLDKAGAYGIQGPSLTFISKVEGDYANVVGFPLSRFLIESENFLRKKYSYEGTWLNYFF